MKKSPDSGCVRTPTSEYTRRLSSSVATTHFILPTISHFSINEVGERGVDDVLSAV